MFFYYFFQKSLFTENYFLIAAINLDTRGPLYTFVLFQTYKVLKTFSIDTLLPLKLDFQHIGPPLLLDQAKYSGPKIN